MGRNVVLDANVIVSAHLKEEGLERFVLDLALAQKIQLFISPEVFAEYRNVLSRPKFRIKPDRVAASLALIKRAAIQVTPQQRLVAAKDPDDNIFP